MAISRETYVADGINSLYVVPFNYLLQAHVEVYIDGAQDSTFTWTTASTITTSVVPDAGSEVLILRRTPTEPLVDFVDGSTLTEDMLDTATRQALFVVEESKNALDAAVLEAIPDESITPLKLSTAFGAWVKAGTATAARIALDVLSSSQISALIAGATLLKATLAEAVAGIEDTKFMTALKTKEAIFELAPDNSIGVGQTWQDLATSRVFGTVYTNTTGRTIVANVSGSGAPNNGVIQGYIDGIAMGQQGVATVASAAMRCTVTLIIPNGSTYEVRNITGASKIVWVELRT
jgi:hypothetical protein